MSGIAPQKFCGHCGAIGEPRLGYCDICGAPVCARCGNIQHVRGERKVAHDQCLRESEDAGFSMIRFVK